MAAELTRPRQRYQPKRKGPFKPAQFVVWTKDEKEKKGRSKSYKKLTQEEYESHRQQQQLTGASSLALHESAAAADHRQQMMLQQRAAYSQGGDLHSFNDQVLAEARAAQRHASQMHDERYVQQMLRQEQLHRQEQQITSSSSQRRTRATASAPPTAGPDPCPTCGNPDYVPEY